MCFAPRFVQIVKPKSQSPKSLSQDQRDLGVSCVGAAVGVGRWLPESVCYAEYSNMRPRLETRSLCSMSEPKYNFKD